MICVEYIGKLCVSRFKIEHFFPRHNVAMQYSKNIDILWLYRKITGATLSEKRYMVCAPLRLTFIENREHNQYAVSCAQFSVMASQAQATRSPSTYLFMLCEKYLALHERERDESISEYSRHAKYVCVRALSPIARLSTWWKLFNCSFHVGTLCRHAWHRSFKIDSHTHAVRACGTTLHLCCKTTCKARVCRAQRKSRRRRKKITLNFVIKVLANTSYIIILYVQSTYNSFFIDIAIRAVCAPAKWWIMT